MALRRISRIDGAIPSGIGKDIIRHGCSRVQACLLPTEKPMSIAWFASCGNKPFVDFIEQFGRVCYRIPTASFTNHQLFRHVLM
jgi:hypothetical protein